MTDLHVCGERAVPIGDKTYAVTYPQPITQQQAEMIHRAWKATMGDAKLIVLDSGAQVTRLAEAESTPIYDALVAERQAS